MVELQCGPQSSYASIPCPWYFKGIVVYARHELHHFIGAGTKAGLLAKLWTSRMVLLQSSADLLNGVRGLYCRIEVLPKKAILYFCCKGRGVLLRTEGALCISIDCYNTARSGHLELEVGVVWHRIESSECGSSKQCMITAAKGDDIED